MALRQPWQSCLVAVETCLDRLDMSIEDVINAVVIGQPVIPEGLKHAIAYYFTPYRVTGDVVVSTKKKPSTNPFIVISVSH